MSAKRRPRSFGGRRALRRNVDWIEGLIGPAGEVSGSTTDAWTIISPSDVELKQDNTTVCRIVGEVWPAAQPTDINTVLRVFLGIARVEFDSLGNVAIYDPSAQDDADYDWMWRRAYDIAPTAVRTDGVAFITNRMLVSHEQAHVDIKVQRKLDAMDGVVLFTRIAVAQGTLEAPIGLVFNLRALVKLS